MECRGIGVLGVAGVVMAVAVAGYGLALGIPALVLLGAALGVSNATLAYLLYGMCSMLGRSLEEIERIREQARRAQQTQVVRDALFH